MNIDLFQELKDTYQIDLNTQQKEVVLHKNGPALILAVPGAGKTTTLLARTAWLIAVEQIHPSNILSLTFSRASANDMKDRFFRVFSNLVKATSLGKVSFSTIHSFSYRLVMAYHRSQGITLTLAEGSEAGKWSKFNLLKRLYFQVNKEYISDGDLEVLINDISYIKNSLMDQGQVRAFRSDISSFFKIYKEYEKIKKEHRLIDFDDMLVSCYHIFKHEPQVLLAYQNRFKYIQVDEAQDTSLLQHEIIRMLAGSHANVVYVADDDQSIYGFRAACPSYLLDIEQHYKKPRILRMEENYRSTGNIVNVSNAFIKENKKRYNKEMNTLKDVGQEVKIEEVKARFHQLDFIRKHMKPNEYGAYAVIYRNNQTAISVAKALVDQNIPFYLREFKNRFFTHWVVKDMMNILAFAGERHKLSLFESFYYRLRGYYISKQMIENCHPSQEDIFDSILHNNSLNAYQRDNVEKLGRAFKRLERMKPYDGMNYVLEDMGYREFLMDRAGASDTSYDTYVDMIYVLRNLSSDCQNLEDVYKKIEDLKHVMLEAAHNNGKNAVTLTTIHGAKGLEWDYVYMIDLLEGVLPARDADKQARSGNEDALEEERRLFYVAMTRAKKSLKLISIKDANPSRFVHEVKDILDLASLETYKVGSQVTHTRFGQGIILSRHRHMAVIDFHKGEKKIDIKYSLQKGLIS